jgi:hypothetical protein
MIVRRGFCKIALAVGIVAGGCSKEEKPPVSAPTFSPSAPSKEEGKKDTNTKPPTNPPRPSM